MKDDKSNSNTRKTKGNIILIDDSLDYTSNKTELDIELDNDKKNPKYLKYNIESSAETTILNMDEFLDDRKSNVSANKKNYKKNIKKKPPVEISLIENKDKKNKKKSKKAGEEEYEVEKIIDKKLQSKKVYYKVKWVGYREDECTWEPIENLKGALFYVEEYEKRQLKKHNEIDKKKNKSHNGLSSNLIEDNSKVKMKNTNDLKLNSVSSNKNNKISKLVNEKVNNSLANKKDKNISHINENSHKEKSQTKVKDTIVKSPVKSKDIKVSIPKRFVENQYEEEEGIPDKIISAYKDKKDELYYVLRWKENRDGSRMKNKDFKASDIKKKYPDIVFEFLESKIKFKAS